MPDLFATLILTRPHAGSERFLAELGDAVSDTVRVVTSPLLTIEPTGTSPRLDGVSAVIFTSANGVAFGGPSRDLRAYCVGPATTAAANEAGWRARRYGDTAEELVERLLAENPPGPFVHVGGVHRRGDVAGRLTRAGIATTAVDVYEQKTLPLTQDARACLLDSLPVIVPLFSPRAARQFSDLARARAPLHIVAISEAAMAETEALCAASRRVAPEPNAHSMSNTVANLLRRVEAGHAPK